MQRFKYYVIFINDCTWLFPLKRKSDFFDYFVKFQKLIENQLDKKMKIFQSDGGREFSSFSFKEHLAY